MSFPFWSSWPFENIFSTLLFCTFILFCPKKRAAVDLFSLGDLCHEPWNFDDVRICWKSSCGTLLVSWSKTFFLGSCILVCPNQMKLCRSENHYEYEITWHMEYLDIYPQHVWGQTAWIWLNCGHFWACIFFCF